MGVKFRRKLLVIMIIFAAFISFSIAILNHIRIKEQAIADNDFLLQQIEQTVTYALTTLDKVFYHFEEDIAGQMVDNTEYLLRMYEENPDVEAWEMNDLNDRLGMEIYMIDEKNVIAYSSKEEDIGLDFNKCCKKLATIIDERREAGTFFQDGIDIEQVSGKATKYSYQATPDKKFVVELGVSLEDRELYSEFDFLEIIEELEMNNQSINRISVLNIGGLPIGEGTGEELSAERRKAFDQTLASGKTREVRVEGEEGTETYQYIAYHSEYDQGSTNKKVIEIVYNDNKLMEQLGEHNKSLLMQLLMILVFTVVVSLIISSWVAQPMYMAFHDQLTGLRNRAAFEEDLKAELRNGTEVCLIMMDLDNFKLVNDYLGHDNGDKLLRLLAQTLKGSVDNDGKIYRMGGDEFTIILTGTSKASAAATAEHILSSVIGKINRKADINGLNVTVSLGIAHASGIRESVDSLYKKADMAMYASKEKGKNRYHVYEAAVDHQEII